MNMKTFKDVNDGDTVYFFKLDDWTGPSDDIKTGTIVESKLYPEDIKYIKVMTTNKFIFEFEVDITVTNDIDNGFIITTTLDEAKSLYKQYIEQFIEMHHEAMYRLKERLNVL